MILLDIEATDLRGPGAKPLDEQPHIVEIAALYVNTYWEGGKLILSDYQNKPMIFRSKPPVPLPKTFTKITGITDDDVKDDPPFVAHYENLCSLFVGEEILVAHNLPYDRGVLATELRRIGREHAFPYPPNQICTVELTTGIYGYPLSQSKLLHHVRHGTEGETAQSHRAEDDVLQLFEIVQWLNREGLLC